MYEVRSSYRRWFSSSSLNRHLLALSLVQLQLQLHSNNSPPCPSITSKKEMPPKAPPPRHPQRPFLQTVDIDIVCDSPSSAAFPRAPKLPVVVVGGGLAGLAASIEASRGGARVTLMEKGNKIGGNSAKATSGTVLKSVLLPSRL